jgi:hypothetical protein
LVDKQEEGISPAGEHKKIQEYLVVKTPLNLALAQSGVFYLSHWYTLAFNLRNKLIAKKNSSQDKDDSDNEEEDYEPGSENKKSGKVLTDIEEEFIEAVGSLEKELVLATTMTPGRQKIEIMLIETLEKFGQITYHLQQKGGFQFPESPIDRGSKKR